MADLVLAARIALEHAEAAVARAALALNVAEAAAMGRRLANVKKRFACMSFALPYMDVVNDRIWKAYLLVDLDLINSGDPLETVVNRLIELEASKESNEMCIACRDIFVWHLMLTYGVFQKEKLRAKAQWHLRGRDQDGKIFCKVMVAVYKMTRLTVPRIKNFEAVKAARVKRTVFDPLPPPGLTRPGSSKARARSADQCKTGGVLKAIFPY